MNVAAGKPAGKSQTTFRPLVTAEKKAGLVDWKTGFFSVKVYFGFRMSVISF